MPREIVSASDRDQSALAREAHAHWSELRSLYDAFEEHVAAGGWAEAAAVAPRLTAVERLLAPLVAARRESVAAGDDSLWDGVDAIVAELVSRQARALATVTAARDATAAELGRVHRTRGHAARYSGAARRTHSLTSRHA